MPKAPPKHTHLLADRIKAAREREVQPARPNAAARGYDGKWRKAREGYLAKHPLCRICKELGRVVAATVVDHIIPHRGDMKLFWDKANWQPLCKCCHDRKTATKDSGFARRSYPRHPH
jgi:5-methylcytosine-specific restriction protein A